MAEIWKPQSPVVHREWLAAITLEASDKLNDWQTNFISSMEDKLDRGLKLTQNEEQKLEQIYATNTS